MYTIVLLLSDTTYVLSELCSNTRLAIYSFLSKASPRSTFAGFLTNACMILGMHSTALCPSTAGTHGTSRHPKNTSPSFSTMISNIFFAWFLLSSSCGKKNMPTPYSRSPPSSIPSGFVTLTKKSWQIWTRMPTPSPVFPSASLPALCSRFSTILRAFSTVPRVFVPLILTTAPIPQLSCSNSAL